MTQIPHLAYPFRLGGNGHARVLEQDTVDEVANCCQVILKTPVGMRIELPEFGYDDPAFSRGTVRADVLAMALNRWEPRATLDIVSALVKDLTESDVTIRVQPRQDVPGAGIQL